MHTDHRARGPSPRWKGVPSGPVRQMQDVLSNPCDRAILYLLQDEMGTVPIATLARRIAASSENPAGRSRRNDRSPPLLWDVRGHVLAMAGLGILGYDAGTDAAWIPDDVTISVAPPRAPAEPRPRDESGTRRRSTDVDVRRGPTGRAQASEDARPGSPDLSPTSSGD